MHDIVLQKWYILSRWFPALVTSPYEWNILKQDLSKIYQNRQMTYIKPPTTHSYIKYLMTLIFWLPVITSKWWQIIPKWSNTFNHKFGVEWHYTCTEIILVKTSLSNKYQHLHVINNFQKNSGTVFSCMAWKLTIDLTKFHHL